jgi:hypothetical protein
MAVLVTANVEGQTEEGWDHVFAMLGPAIRQAKGFIAVGGGHSHGGWRTFEIWESAEDATISLRSTSGPICRQRSNLTARWWSCAVC